MPAGRCRRDHASHRRRQAPLDGEDAATVEAFATADLNVTRAAQALQVHPNTVRYRLDRIAAETGLTRARSRVSLS